jgi:opacity protein-like surface antigen
MILRRLSGVALTLALIAGIAGAQGRDRGPLAPDYHRFSLSMAGGFGFSESHRGLFDLQTELQYGLTSRLRLGLGFGYMRDRGRQAEWSSRDQRGSMDWNDFNAGSQNSGLEARIMPLSLNLYYGLPIGRKWSVFMNGGGSFYFGSFDGPRGDQHKHAWGAQAGLGIEYRIAQSIQLVAEAAYRFVEFHGVLVQDVQADSAWQWMLPIMDSMVKSNNAAVSRVADFLRGELVQLAPKPIRSTDMNLNGLSLRMGVKFGI